MTFVHTPCARSRCTIHLDWCPAPLASSSSTLTWLHLAEQKVQLQGQTQNLPEKTAHTKPICLTITILLLGLRKWSCQWKAGGTHCKHSALYLISRRGEFPALCFPEPQQTCSHAAGSGQPDVLPVFTPQVTRVAEPMNMGGFIYKPIYKLVYKFHSNTALLLSRLCDLVEKAGDVLLPSPLQLT